MSAVADELGIDVLAVVLDADLLVESIVSEEEVLEDVVRVGDGMEVVDGVCEVWLD